MKYSPRCLVYDVLSCPVPKRIHKPWNSSSDWYNEIIHATEAP